MGNFDWYDLNAPVLGLEETEEARAKRETRRRNIAIALVLAGLVVLFYVMTMVRIHP